MELARGPAPADARRTWARGQHSDRTARLSGIPRSGKIAGIMPKAAPQNAKNESPRCPLGTGKPRAFGDFRPARTHLPLSAVSVLPTASFDVRAKIFDSGFLVEGSVNQFKIRSPAKSAVSWRVSYPKAWCEAGEGTQEPSMLSPTRSRSPLGPGAHHQ